MIKRVNKKNRSKFKCHLHKIFANIKKFSHWIVTNSTFYSIAKNTLIFICSLIFTFFVYLLIQTKSPISDVFTAGRISILKDRPANITRDVIVDMSYFNEPYSIVILTSALISDIAKKRPNWRLSLIVSKGSKSLYDTESPNIKIIEIERFPLTHFLIEQLFDTEPLVIFHDKLIQLLYYDRIFCDKECDLIWDPIGYIGYCNFVDIPRISTIHDIALFDTYPPFIEINALTLSSRTCTKRAIHFSKRIITVSEFSKNRICDKFRVNRDLVKSIPIKLSTRVYSDNCPEKISKIMNKYKLEPKKYFIFCSGWWANKNHGNLMKAFHKFAEKNSDIKLILVGRHFNTFKSRPIKDYCSDRLIITGFVPDEELGILLKNALAFIHPSVYEGFGMPIIEAMANGIPVACSNVASLPEVAGSAALLFDPFKIDSITQAMHRLADDSQLREDLIQKGYEQAKKYSDRDAMVDEYIRVMEEVMHENDLKKSRK